jgi:hypothetical protein
MPETLDEIWEGDLLGRRKDAVDLQRFLVARARERGRQNRPRSYVINIDARWGQGKSFFLGRFARQLRSIGHLVVEINAWNNDSSTDPFLLLMSEMDVALGRILKKKKRSGLRWEAVRENAGKIMIAGLKGISTTYLRKIIGSGVNELAELIEGHGIQVDAEALQAGADAIEGEATNLLSDLIDEFRLREQAAKGFQANLAATIKEFFYRKEDRYMFVIVDELDRCRPTFAIELLERVKHLFEVDRVIFVFATDLEQLSHAISVVYGVEFASKKYLFRFFDRTYTFNSIDNDSFCRMLVSRSNQGIAVFPNLNHVDEAAMVSAWASHLGLSLRDIEQAWDVARTAISMSPYESELEIGVLFLHAALFQQKHYDGWRTISENIEKCRSENKSDHPALVLSTHKNGRRLEVNIRETLDHICKIVERRIIETPIDDLPSHIRDFLNREVAARNGLSRNQFWAFSRYPDLIMTAGRLKKEDSA